MRVTQSAHCSAKRALGSLLLLGAFACVTCGSLTAQWQKGTYFNTFGQCPPFVFVAMPATANFLNEKFGTDAAEDTNRYELDLGKPGRTLMFMHELRMEPETIFPLAGVSYSHLNLPTASPYTNGSVHEPTVYHYHDGANDQYWVIFSFAADVVSHHVSKPCDLFAINVTPALANPTTFDPTLLVTCRLTSAVRSATTPPDNLLSRSFNPRLMGQFPWGNGNCVYWVNVGGIQTHYETNTGACVVDEEHGPVLYYASNERRTDQQGMKAGDLAFTGGLTPSVSLVNQREIQHFGSTSMISFFESPAGAAGSYRSNTEGTGIWGIFEFRSDEAQWQTVSGYANQGNIADHNGTMLSIEDPREDLFAISRYYINNNESFGTVVLLPYNDLGRNIDDGHQYVENVGALPAVPLDPAPLNLFPDISLFQDRPSCVGKFAHPATGRAGATRADVELFLTYSPRTSSDKAHTSFSPHFTCTNGNTAEGYHARLVVVTDVSAPIVAQGNPATLLHPSNPIQTVLEHPSIHAFSMRPVLTQKERFGSRHRTVMPQKGKVDFSAAPALVDMPVAQVTAGPIYNTDVRALGRRISTTGCYYDPTTEPRDNSGTDKLMGEFACLTKDADPSDFMPGHIFAGDVWGIRVFVTDAQVRKVHWDMPDDLPLRTGSRMGYLHHNGAGSEPILGRPVTMERYRHLSDIPADASGKVNFLLPANVPVKFFLLHKDGTVLAQHRNHHSFAPGQVENRCTGCHQHVTPTPGPATSTTAPFDTLTQTGKYGWHPVTGAATFTVTNTPTEPVPEFIADIWPILNNHCRQCHDTSGSAFNMSMNHSLNISSEVEVWAWLNKQRYINRRLGAAKSPFAWYFSGVPDDFTDRLDGEKNSRYKGTMSHGSLVTGGGGSPSRYWISTVDANNNAIHGGIPDRSLAYKVIEWIDAGAPIDHDIADPNPQLGDDETRGTKGDGYQIAVSVKLDSFASNTLKIGYWDVDASVSDEKGDVTDVQVRVLGGATTSYPVGGLGNRVQTHTLPAGLSDTAIVEVVVIDRADNRCRVQKSMRQLRLESETYRGRVNLTTNGTSFTGGETVDFGVGSDPSFAGNFFFLLMSEGIHPGQVVDSLGVDVWLVGNDDQWFTASLNAGVHGPLNAGGRASWPWMVPPVGSPIELYCQAAILTPAAKLAKSNFVSIRLH